MLNSIDLNDQAPIEADEVDGEAPQRMLAAKLETLELTLAHLRPQNALLLGRPTAQMACALVRHLQALQDQKIPPTLSLPRVVSKTRLRHEGGGDDEG